jgi:hypothetical protein
MLLDLSKEVNQVPQSRKRKKKPTVEEQQKKKSSNIVKRPIGKFVIILLSAGFVLSVLVSLIYTLVQVMQA